jgi:hypothetical protein
MVTSHFLRSFGPPKSKNQKTPHPRR